MLNKYLLSKWLNIEMLILALLFTPTWFFSLVPELFGHSWLVSAQEHVRDPWVHLHTASNCTSYNTRQIRMGMHICDSQLTPRASPGMDAARRNLYISGLHWAKAWLEAATFHSSFVYENGTRGQSDRSCQVLKWIIRCFSSEAYKRDELKIQLQEHLGRRRISEVP